MPTFQYVAKRGPKDVVEGVLEAEHRSTVLDHLAGLGYVPVRVVEQAKPEGPTGAAESALPTIPSSQLRVPRRALHLLIRQLASLLRSQVPLMRALHILQEQTEHPGLRRVLAQIAERVRQGAAFSEALAAYPTLFLPLMTSLIRAGEVSGTLDNVLEQLAQQAEHDDAMRSKVQTAAAYPVCVAAVGCATIAILMVFVLPRLLRLFINMGQDLPLPTRILIVASRAASNGWMWGGLLLVVVVAVLCYRQFQSSLRPLIDGWTLKMPVLGPLIHHIEWSRFARSFALLLDHGVPILRATDVVIPVVGHHVMREELRRLPDGLRQGTSLAMCLKSVSTATPFVVNTIAVGEEGGRLSEALTEIATFYERETERQLQILSSLLEPAMMLLVGAVVGFIVMAILMPIFFMSFTVR